MSHPPNFFLPNINNFYWCLNSSSNFSTIPKKRRPFCDLSNIHNFIWFWVWVTVQIFWPSQKKVDHFYFGYDHRPIFLTISKKERSIVSPHKKRKSFCHVTVQFFLPSHKKDDHFIPLLSWIIIIGLWVILQICFTLTFIIFIGSHTKVICWRPTFFTV